MLYILKRLLFGPPEEKYITRAKNFRARQLRRLHERRLLNCQINGIDPVRGWI